MSNGGTSADLPERCLFMHIKVLTDPSISIDAMVEGMQEVYATAGIRVEEVSRERLNLPLLTDVDVGECVLGSVTDEQEELFGNRNNVSAGDVVVYFVRSTIPPFNGCAAHPAGKPGAVVARIASVWTLAHEVGHVLGLRHVSDRNRLMTGQGTHNITNPPPDLVSSEVTRMRQSPLVRDC
jgi:hypothetical protein